MEIIKIENPFDRTRRETERVHFIPGQSLRTYIPDENIEFILNGNWVEQPETTYPCDGDQIIVMPHVGGGSFKKILGVIASVALAAYTGKVADGLWGLGKGSIASCLASGTVAVLGGKIINALVPVERSGLSSQETTQTYGWDLPKPITGEGGVVGVTYGECIPAPQLLESHLDTVDDKQYLNLLFCGGMGPVDEISNIKIGDNPIENYTDVQIETRLGTNDQTAITYLGNTTNNQEISHELQDAWATYVADNTDAQGLQVSVEFPSGLYHLNDKGNLTNAWVELESQYRLVGGEWQNWLGSTYVASSGIAGAKCAADAPAETWTILCLGVMSLKGSVSGKMASNLRPGELYDNGKISFVVPRIGTYTIVTASTARITAAQNTAVRRSYSLENLAPGKYEVRMRVKARSAVSGTRDSTTVYWTRLTTVIYGNFCRPNKVLIGLRILATGQLSGGIPSVTWRQRRDTVYAWNPYTKQYQAKRANNPIWAAYDIYHQCRLLRNINTGQDEYVVFGIKHDRLDPYWDEWMEAAAYADGQIEGPDGPENRFEFDAFFDTALKRQVAAQKAATVGHATIMLRGNNISIVCDKPGVMTQVFGEGRTVMSSFQGSFTGIEDRTKSVEVIFSDTENDFKNTQFQVRSEDWAVSSIADDTPTQLQLFGVKRRSQAKREGDYTLANNLLVTQFVDISTDIDAMVSQYGDIVGLNHAVSQIGIASGRLVAATEDSITLDKTVLLSPGKSYEIIISLATDKLVKRYIVAVAKDTETDTLTVTESFGIIPEKYDNYVFGEVNKSVKPFRLVGVTKNGDFKCQLKLAEYVEGVYDGDLNYPVVDYTPPAAGTLEVSNLSVSFRVGWQGYGTVVPVIYCSWQLPSMSVKSVIVYYSADDGATWTKWSDMLATEAQINGVKLQERYLVKVCTVNELGLTSAGVVSDPIYITDEDLPAPEHVTNIFITENNQNQGNNVVLNELYVACTPPDSLYYSHAEWYIKSHNPGVNEYDLTDPAFYDVPVEDIGAMLDNWKLVDGAAKDNITIKNLILGETYSIKVVAVNTLGKKADFDTAPVKTHTITGKTTIPSTPDNFVVQITDVATCTWTRIPDTDCDFYELRADQNPGVNAGLLARTASTKALPTLAERQGTLYLYAHNTAGTVGKYSVPASYSYYKAPPPMPQNVTITGIFQGFRLTTEALPTHCIGINVHVDGQVYFSNNNTYTYEARSGIFQIQVAFVDIFGEGALSPVELVEVQSQIAIGELEDAAQEAIEKAQKSVAQETFNNAMEAVDGAMEVINDAVTELGETTVSKTEFTETKNELALVDTENRTLISQTTEFVSVMNGKLASAPDAPGQFESIAALNVKNNQIALVVNENKTATDNAIAAVDIKANQISQTVASNKQDADGKIETLTGQINAVPGKITAAVTEAKQDITNNQIAPVVTRVAAIEVTTEGITNTVSGLQTQVDGKAANWVYSGVPTLSNQPAVNWNTAALKEKHLGDIYYDTSGKAAYVFSKAGATYSWQGITADVDLSEIQSQINQQNNQISSIVTSTLANTQVTAILQMLQGLYFRAADGSLQSLLVITPTEVYINTGYLRIAANTKIDGNVIASGMIQAGAVKAGHLESNTVSAMFANFGTFVSAGADGSKTTISGPLITVHHPNGKLAARFGRW
nr:phage tail protein [Dendrosporobacter quercicolus]